VCYTRQFEHSLGDIQALVWVLSTSRWRQYSITNTFHTLHESRVPVEHHRTLEVCRLEYLKTSRMPQYSNMNTFHTSHESRVPVEHHRTLEVCRLEYLETSPLSQ